MIILILMFLSTSVKAKDEITIDFITKFIEQENKPTQLVYGGLCWSKNAEFDLLKAIQFRTGTRITGSLNISTVYQEQTIIFFTDLDCSESEEFLYYASLQHLFRFPYRWLVLVESKDESNLVNLRKCHLTITSDLVLVRRHGDYFSMLEVHKPAHNDSIITTQRGYFNGSLIDLRPHRELYKRRRNLMGHPLTMANIIQDSNTTKYFLPRDDRLELQNDAVAKVCWVYAKIAFEMLNATPQYIFSYRFGYKVNGKWSGMVRDIGDNKADLGTNCVLFKERLEMITYTDLVAPMRMRFVFRQPPLAYVTNIFALPFSTGVWSAIAVASIMCTITLYLTSLLEVRIERNPTQLDGSIGDALLLTMSAVAQQGCFIEPRKSPGRIMEFVFFTALMALYAAYSANIVVLLQAPSNSIKNLAQLAASKVTLAANDKDYNRFVFNDNIDPLHIAVHETIIPDNGEPKFYEMTEGVERIRQGLFAFHSIVEPIYRRIEDTFQENEKCDLTEVDYINSLDAFTPVKKDSPYLELLRVSYKHIREVGIQAALNKRYQVPKPRCESKAVAFSSVGLMDLQPVIIMMLYGISLSVAILLMEIAVYKIDFVASEVGYVLCTLTFTLKFIIAGQDFPNFQIKQSSMACNI